MTTFTTEDREAVIQGATGAQYQPMDTSPQATQVRQIVNNICRELQALSTVIISLQAEVNAIRRDAAVIARQTPTLRRNGEDDCGK